MFRVRCTPSVAQNDQSTGDSTTRRSLTLGPKRALLLMGLSLALAACEDDESILFTEPSIEVELSEATLAVTPGAMNSVTATVSRRGQFTGAVDLLIENLPAGITATAVPSTLGVFAPSSVITFRASNSVASGTHEVTVRARAGAVTDRTATLSLVVTPSTGYALAVGPSPISVTQGGTGTVSVTIARAPSFTGAVALALESAPVGVTGTFDPVSTTGATSTLTIAVGAAVTPGTYTLLVRGSAAGLTDRTATITLTVTAAPAGFTLSVSPQTVSVPLGRSSTATVTITRTGGFTGSVALAVTGAPAGLTATFNPTSTTASSSTLTLTATTGTALGTYTLTIRGTASGFADQTTQLSVAVVP